MRTWNQELETWKQRSRAGDYKLETKRSRVRNKTKIKSKDSLVRNKQAEIESRGSVVRNKQTE